MRMNSQQLKKSGRKITRLTGMKGKISQRILIGKKMKLNQRILNSVISSNPETTATTLILPCKSLLTLAPSIT